MAAQRRRRPRAALRRRLRARPPTPPQGTRPIQRPRPRHARAASPQEQAALENAWPAPSAS